MADPLAQVLEASGGGNIWAVLGLAVSGALGKYAWEFYKKKAELGFKEKDNVRKDTKEEKLLDRKERNEFKDDLKERVAALEVKLEAALKAKEDLLEQVGELRAKLAKIETKLEILLAGGKVMPESPTEEKPKPKKVVKQSEPEPTPSPKRGRQKKNV